ncbi:MAG: bifunctional glutamine synthetase adenylyltransferase/deadenyltransferase, partial [Methylophilaceae bacterium]
GMLYETDLQLRPDGASGLLVSTVDAFREYQHNKAWVWEHQALTRAAFSAGDQGIGAAFSQIRHDVLTQTRDLVKLREDVLSMRQKMHDSQKTSTDLFDLKQDAGGIIDVEFMVQYMVLANAAQYPQLTQNIGNIALLGLLADIELIDQAKALEVANAYRDFRSLQHAIRLQGESKVRVPLIDVKSKVDAVKDLWADVFVSG